MPAFLLGLGFGAGVLSGVFGIGGGVLIMVGLRFLKMPMHTAIGTSLGALLLPVGFFAALEYWRNGHMDMRAAVLLAIGLAVGAWVGARYAQTVTPAALQRAFAVFLAVMAVRFWFKTG
jgi:uncharacterized membrane protein YfcA